MKMPVLVLHDLDDIDRSERLPISFAVFAALSHSALCRGQVAGTLLKHRNLMREYSGCGLRHSVCRLADISIELSLLLVFIGPASPKTADRH
jgi:hypothetical protein